MKKLAILLIIGVALMVIGCQPPAGVTSDQIDALKSEISALKTDVGVLKTAVDSLTANYNAHLDKYHKGFVPGGGGTKPPGGGNLKPPTGK
jgi:hypothetical protein